MGIPCDPSCVSANCCHDVSEDKEKGGGGLLESLFDRWSVDLDPSSLYSTSKEEGSSCMN